MSDGRASYALRFVSLGWLNAIRVSLINRILDSLRAILYAVRSAQPCVHRGIFSQWSFGGQGFSFANASSAQRVYTAVGNTSVFPSLDGIPWRNESTLCAWLTDVGNMSRRQAVTPFKGE